MKLFGKFVSLLPYFLVFVASLYLPSDPDLGWHLKYGEYFFQHGTILRDNSFSTMMPDFHWANVSWGTDVIGYLAYALGGFLGLTILSAIIVTLTFFFFSKSANLSLWEQTLFFPLMLYLEQQLNSISFRGQQISMLFLGVLAYLISLYEKKPKIIYLTVPLFWIWVNLHGEFFLGLAFFAVWIAVIKIQKFFTYKKDYKKVLYEEKQLVIVFLLSFIATFINPFGFNIHLGVIDQIGTPLLKDIAEYLPFKLLSQQWWNQVVIAIFLGMSLIFYYFKENLTTKIPYLSGTILLYLLSFNVSRYAWPTYYLILPFIKPLAGIFKPDRQRTTAIVSFILLFCTLVIIWVDKYPFSQFSSYSWSAYCNYKYINCSPKSAQFLIDHKLTKNIFSQYGWGGWLIWNYPQIKPTIDGRMHIWKDEKGYSGFVDYYSYEQNNKEINQSKYNVVYMSPDKPLYNHMLILVENKKWKMVYQDNRSGIFMRID